MMKGMAWVILVSFLASFLLVQAFFYLQPYVVEMFMSPFHSSANPHLKEDLDIGLYKRMYYQQYPVLFPSPDREILLDSLANRTQFICPSEAKVDRELSYNEDDEDDFGSNITSSYKCINAPLCEVQIEDEASHAFGLGVERNILAIPEVQEVIQVPKLHHSFTGEMYPITNLTTPIRMILSESSFRTTRPIFQQLPQSWELLIHGRKKWYFYKPGQFPVEGYDPKSSLQDWLHEVLPSLKASHLPIEMIQEEGQVIYIPEGWFQASVPLPHPQGQSAYLAPLLSSIKDSTPESCASISIKKNNNVDESVVTLSLRQSAIVPEITTSLFYRISMATEAIKAKEYYTAIDILRDTTMSVTEFTSTYLLGKAICALIEEKISLSHRRDEVSGELVNEAEQALKRSIALNRLNVFPHVTLIELFLKMKRYSDAETALKAALLLGFSDHEELNSFKYIFNIGH